MILWLRHWRRGNRSVYASKIQTSKRNWKIVVQFSEGEETVKTIRVRNLSTVEGEIKRWLEAKNA